MLTHIELARWCHAQARSAIKKSEQSDVGQKEMWLARALAMQDVVKKMSSTINAKRQREPIQPKLIPQKK